MKETVLLNLFDVDGCLFHYCQFDGKHHPEQTLVSQNKKLLDFILQRSQTENITKMIIGLGCSRQDAKFDLTNDSGTGSAMPVLPLLQHFFANQIENTVLDPFLMADIYGLNYAPGDTFKSILKARNYASEPIKEDISTSSFYLFDCYKLSIVYAYCHRTAVFHPKANIIIDFYDDALKKVLQPMQLFFQAYADLLPKNVTLFFHHYEKGQLNCSLKPVKGRGIIDEHFAWSIRYLAYNYFIGDALPFIKSPKDLETYHTDQAYLQHGPLGLRMFFDQKFDLSHFQNDRLRLIPKLPTQKVETISNYTTAVSLQSEGWIPASFLLRDESYLLPGQLPAVSTLVKQGLYSQPLTVTSLSPKKKSSCCSLQ